MVDQELKAKYDEWIKWDKVRVNRWKILKKKTTIKFYDFKC